MIREFRFTEIAGAGVCGAWMVIGEFCFPETPVTDAGVGVHSGCRLPFVVPVYWGRTGC